MKQYLLPKEIIDSKNVCNLISLKKRRERQVILNTSDKWLNSLTNAFSGYIVLDFGKEMNGGVRIITSVCEKSFSKIRIRFGESISEVYSNIGEKGATNDHNPRDFETCLSSLGDHSFGKTGFRFVRIDFLEQEKIVLQNIYCENNILNKKANYVYGGKDRLVGDIYKTAKRTIDLCSAGEYIVDGIKRDRLVWVGDLHPEMLALVTLYGRLPIIERSLEFVKKHTQDEDWMNGISTYSMWWAIIVTDYYFLTCAKDFILKHIDYLKFLIDKFDVCVDKNGELNYGWLFVDWQTTDSLDAEAGVRAINLICVKNIIKLFNELGVETKKAQGLLKKLNKKSIKVQKMKQVVALKYFAEGMIDDSDYKLLISNNAAGMSTFMSYYILKAVASKDVKLAITMMKEYYGAMLELGATTFFEDFDIEWIKDSTKLNQLAIDGQKDFHGDNGAHCYEGFRHSLCHGWSSGVIKFIKEYCD